MKLLELKLARPREIPLLRMAGYECIGAWDQSFELMQLACPHAETDPGHVSKGAMDGSGSQRRTGSGRKKGAPDHARMSE